jgi:hypothetical protein
MKGAGGVNKMVRVCWLLIFVGLATQTGCDRKQPLEEGNEPQETKKVRALRKEVVKVHDEVMPLLTDIYQLKINLREKLSSEKPDAAKRRTVEEILVKLDSADRGMRVWMREFSKVKTEGIPEDEALEKLRDEMKKITKVKNDMIESVQAAKAVD